MTQDTMLTIIYLMIGIPIAFGTIGYFAKSTHFDSDFEVFSMGVAFVVFTIVWPGLLVVGMIYGLGLYLRKRLGE